MFDKLTDDELRRVVFAMGSALSHQSDSVHGYDELSQELGELWRLAFDELKRRIPW